MNEQTIKSSDPTKLSADDLDDFIGSCARKIKQLKADRQSTNTLKEGLTARIKALQDSQKSARLERKGRD